METKEVPVERYVEQVVDGLHYKGYLKIADTKIDYELVFEVPIEQLDSVEPSRIEDDFRRLFQITVSRNNAVVELTKDEYGFFFEMTVELAVDFYHNPQTRDNNEGFMGMAVRGEHSMPDFLKASVGMTSSGLYRFPLELCEILSVPKFSCSLVEV